MRTSIMFGMDAAITVATVAPSVASATDDGGSRTLAEVLLADAPKDGTGGFDRRWGDYDIVTEAVLSQEAVHLGGERFELALAQRHVEQHVRVDGIEGGVRPGKWIANVVGDRRADPAVPPCPRAGVARRPRSRVRSRPITRRGKRACHVPGRRRARGWLGSARG